MARCVAVCNDLLFSSKISGTADLLNVETVVVPDAASAKEYIDEQTMLVLADLASPPISAEQLHTLRQILPRDGRLVAYGSHVDTARLQEAKQAGCDLVLPRSEFVNRLPAMLNEAKVCENAQVAREGR